MTYNANKLFRFEKTEGGCIITDFAQNQFFDKEDEIITKINIPARYRGRRVVGIGKDAFRSAWHLQKVTVPEGVRRIGKSAFQNCKSLRSVSLPASLEEIGGWSFMFCEELREVEFKSYPSFGEFVFSRDIKLPAELILTGLVCSRDLTRPLNERMLLNEFNLANDSPKYTPCFCLRPDVFELAAKNACFRNLDAAPLTFFMLFEYLIKKKCAEQLNIAEHYGVLNAALADKFLEYSVRQGKTEVTAYLLDYKQRKFGFDKEDDYDLL